VETGFAQWERIVQTVMIFAVALALIRVGLKALAVIPPDVQAPSRRLREIRDSLTKLQATLGHLVAEVDVTSANAEGLERRPEETQRLGLSTKEKDAIFRELDPRDRSSSRQNIAVFAAGVAAGVLTNLIIK
jgi:predicted nuclease with TOPRIM domain